jgi:hypothetical protein
MATYGEVPINVVSKAKSMAYTAPETIYTCPAGRYAKGRVAVRATGVAAKVKQVSANAIGGAYAWILGEISTATSEPICSTDFLLGPGDSIVMDTGSSSGGDLSYVMSALEYPVPS